MQRFWPCLVILLQPFHLYSCKQRGASVATSSDDVLRSSDSHTKTKHVISFGAESVVTLNETFSVRLPGENRPHKWVLKSDLRESGLIIVGEEPETGPDMARPGDPQARLIHFKATAVGRFIIEYEHIVSGFPASKKSFFINVKSG